MNYAEALKLTRKNRRSNSLFAGVERSLQKHNMSTAQREELGALFHEFASEVGKRSTRTHAIEYVIETKAGLLTVNYCAYTGTIFGRFKDPTAAVVLLGGSVNPYSGKWNHHTSKGDDPRYVFAGWKAAMLRLLPST
jgi:hypothetical protein